MSGEDIMSLALGLFSKPWPYILLAVTLVVIGAVVMYVVRQIAASKPTITFTSPKGPTVKVAFPTRSRRK